MMKFLKMLGYALPVILVSGVLTLPFFWIMNRINTDPLEDSRQSREEGCGAGCVMTLLNLALLVIYVAALVVSARWTIAVLNWVFLWFER